MQIQVKSETSLDNVRVDAGGLKSTECSAGGTAKDMQSASLALLPSERQRRRDCRNRYRTGLSHNPVIVPVLAPDGDPLMPTCASRARRWVSKSKATPFWLNGVWCVRLKTEPSGRVKQEVAVGIDPGSKREAYTIASKSRTYLNVLADAVTWVKEAVETRRMLRRNRRNRNTPYRANRGNRSRCPFPPSTKARWQLKMRIVAALRRMYPVSGFAVEDVAATTRGKSKRWNTSFSPLETGKRWFYTELRKRGALTLKAGHETAEVRKSFSLVKSVDKMSLSFYVHNVDSWVLAKDALGTQKSTRPENIQVIHCVPLQFRRRALHLQNPSKGNVRRRHGGTVSLGFKRGSLVKHPKYGLTTIGGTMGERVSLHQLDGERLCQNAKPKDIIFLRRTSLLFRPVARNGIPPTPKGVGLLPKIL